MMSLMEASVPTENQQTFFRYFFNVLKALQLWTGRQTPSESHSHMSQCHTCHMCHMSLSHVTVSLLVWLVPSWLASAKKM